MRKLFLFAASIILIAAVLAESNETNLTKIDPCPQIYEFITDHYNNGLIYTDEEFEVLRMQTVLLKEELENYIMYYDEFCSQELPFINYNNKLPGSVEIKTTEQRTLREGFNEFLDVFKGDLKFIVLLIGGIILLVYVLDHYA